MAVSLTKKPLVREYTPEHIRSEEETLPPKQPNGYTPEHIVVEPAPQPLTKPRYSGGNIIGCGVRTFTSTA